MKRSHSLRFEALEARQLLSRGHLAVGHAAHVALAASAPLVLNGTLVVINKLKAAITTTNANGSTTTAVPVAGQLGSMGPVRGVWSESVDAYGNYSGPDTLVLRNARGSVFIAFNNQNSARAAARVPGGVTYQHPQRVFGGTRAFAGASETGTITLTTSTARAEVVGLTLQSATS